MSEEIKIDNSSIKGALAELKSSIHSLETSISKEVVNENVLDMTDKLNETKRLFEEIIASYNDLW
ncbi:YwqI/YxiC family protein [Halobacillus shinanisalinarum]|uniref:YwqI/YxiC family protein n=1 Tax=Halobacillus shinanisalinarum TaxID=2932258 RepID=A0ABY4H275_9BACI|nr:DUF5344 family protein [Halobacillus shinanisalinarum]UOQ94558.1 YwqI/YxiC family protein [Halobacillus shinanisalinarum]